MNQADFFQEPPKPTAKPKDWDGKYSIIYADPPWQYQDKCESGERGASFKYDLMDLEAIKALPIQNIASQDSILFMWATMPLLKEALEVIEAWGFTFKTCAFTWIKHYKDRHSWFMGMGNWTRANAELCLLATRGKPKRLDAGISQIIYAPIKRHSEKPQEARDRIVKLVGDLPRVELFARSRADGWDVFGNELESDINLNISKGLA